MVQHYKQCSAFSPTFQFFIILLEKMRSKQIINTKEFVGLFFLIL